MQDCCDKVAVLLFSRTAEQEAQNKSLGHTRQSNHALHRVLVHQVRKTITQTQLTCFWINEKHQKGQNFGEKLSNAFKDVFALGYSKVVAVGSDCINLSSDDILSAADRLRNNDVVLGPTQKGGTYLIGLSDIAFDEAFFKTLLWQSKNNFKSLKRYFEKRSFSVYNLQKRYEINDLSQWRLILQNVDGYFKLKLRRWLGIIEIISWAPVLKVLLGTFFYSYSFLRGPPRY